MKQLRVSPDLALPIGIANKTICIFGKGGSGKSNLEVVLAEELYAAGVPTCIVDPADIHYGIKSARDGKSAGLPFIVFGGLHADVPIYPENGALLADLFLDRGLYMVIVTQPWTGGERSRFMTEFANQLYKRGPEKEQRGSARVLMLEEAHEYVPLVPGKGEEVMLGAMKRLYTVGRNYWIGFIAATRRPAKMHTDLRNGADATAFFQIVGTQDRKAMTDYLGEMAEKDVRDEILSHLAKMPVGEAYFYQPNELPAVQRVKFRKRNTLDTTTTEITAGHKVIKPVLAEVDLEQLGDAMAAAREKAKADDPRELKKRIRELELLLKAKGSVEVQVVEKIVEIPVLDRSAVARIQGAVEDHLTLTLRDIDSLIADVIKSLQNEQSLHTGRIPATARLQGRVAQPAVGAGARVGPDRSSSRPDQATQARPVPPALTKRSPNGHHLVPPDIKLGKGERKVLSVLAQWPDGRMQRDLAFLTGYSARASTLGVILSKLRQAELVEAGQPIRATEAGLDAAGGVQQLPTGPDLLNHWLSHPRIGEGERKVLRTLIDAHPDALTHAELCERTGYSPDASTIGVILSKLRKLGLVEPGQRRIPDSFMEAIT